MAELAYLYPTIYEALNELQQGICWYCPIRMLKPGTLDSKGRSIHSSRSMTRDHLIPISYQLTKGWHIPLYENVILCCRKCNGNRSSALLDERALRRARDLNRRALHLYRTAIGPRHTARPLVFSKLGNKNNKTSEIERSSICHPGWEYLLKETQKAAKFRPDLRAISCGSFERESKSWPANFGDSVPA